MIQIRISLREFLERLISNLRRKEEYKINDGFCKIDSAVHMINGGNVVGQLQQGMEIQTKNPIFKAPNMKFSAKLGRKYILRRYVLKRYCISGSELFELEKTKTLIPIKDNEKSYYHIDDLERIFRKPFYAE